MLNERVGGPAIISCWGRGRRPGRSIDEGEITMGEVLGALEKMKCGKAAGVDDIAPESLKRGGWSMVEWMRRLFNVCMERGEVPEEWQRACIVPLYKGKGDKRDCAKYRGVSLLSVPWKVWKSGNLQSDCKN